MAKRSKKMVTQEQKEPQKKSIQDLTADERIRLIEELLDTLTSQELLDIYNLAGKFWKRKVTQAKKAILDEMKEKLTEVGLSLNDIIPSRRTYQQNTSSIHIKYRSPDGRTWSGKGRTPGWLRQLEGEGHSREEYAASAQTAM